VNRTKPLISDLHGLPTPEVARFKINIIHLKRGQVAGINPKLGLNPNTKMPTHLSQRAHQLSICEATIGQKDNLTGKG